MSDSPSATFGSSTSSLRESGSAASHPCVMTREPVTEKFGTLKSRTLASIVVLASFASTICDAMVRAQMRR